MRVPTGARTLFCYTAGITQLGIISMKTTYIVIGVGLVSVVGLVAWLTLDKTAKTDSTAITPVATTSSEVTNLEPVPEVVTPVEKTTTPVKESGTGAYTVADVVSVTTQEVDPIPAAVDDEYTLYTVTLKDKSIRSIKAYGFGTFEMTQQNFYTSGYAGDVMKLMALAKKAGVDTSHSPSMQSVTQTNREVTVSMKLSFSVAAGIPAVTGPVIFGKVDWGDGGMVSPVSALVTSSTLTQTFTAKHLYAKAGTYTVTVTDTEGKSATEQVVVK